MADARSDAGAGLPEDGLVVTRVRKRWGDQAVVDGVDLTVLPGRRVRVTGANGAGKTTLLRIVAGVVRPDEGSVRLGRLDADRDRRRFLARLGYVSAGDRALYPRLSALEHLHLGAGMALAPRGRRRAAVARAVEQFGLGLFAARQAQRLSLGQRQRLRLAVAFVHEPCLVLLDEPANSLDEEGVRFLQEALARLTARGGSALWCEPGAAESALPSDERHVLRDGRLHAA